MKSLVDKLVLGQTVKNKFSRAFSRANSQEKNSWRFESLHKPGLRAGEALLCSQSSTEPGLKLLASSQD